MSPLSPSRRRPARRPVVLLRLTAPSWRAFRVWRRNYLQGLGHWHTTIVPPLLEPLLYLAAFGAGVGRLITDFSYGGEPVSYVRYIAPALVVVAAMFMSFFETSYSSFVRMFYQRIWDAMTATPLSLGDILLGEVLWGATRGTVAGLLVAGVVAAFGLTPVAAIPTLLLAAGVTAVLFAVIGLLFTSFLPSIDAFNYPYFLFLLPLFLFGETFFPVAVMPGWVGAVASWMPLYHIMAVARPAVFGMATRADLWHLLPWLAAIPLLLLVSHGLMARRLIH
jgi:lipooligosaccharide transport system permease protein